MGHLWRDGSLCFHTRRKWRRQAAARHEKTKSLLEVEGQRIFAGDQARGTVKGEVEPGPLGHDQQAILKLDQVEQVDKGPNHPGGPPGKRGEV